MTDLIKGLGYRIVFGIFASLIISLGFLTAIFFIGHTFLLIDYIADGFGLSGFIFLLLPFILPLLLIYAAIWDDNAILLFLPFLYPLTILSIVLLLSLRERNYKNPFLQNFAENVPLIILSSRLPSTSRLNSILRGAVVFIFATIAHITIYAALLVLLFSSIDILEFIFNKESIRLINNLLLLCIPFLGFFTMFTALIICSKILRGNIKAFSIIFSLWYLLNAIVQTNEYGLSWNNSSGFIFVIGGIIAFQLYYNGLETPLDEDDENKDEPEHLAPPPNN